MSETSERSRELVEAANREYRRNLHARIGAMQKRLAELEATPRSYEWLKRRKLRLRIATLERELNQRALFTLRARP